MSLRWIAAITTASFFGAALPARAAAPPAARIVGTLHFLEGGRRVTPAEAERAVGGWRISVAFRSGWTTVAARLDKDGGFAADVTPGTWRLEWIDVGDRAEVLATPLELEARADAPTCAGRIELAYADLASELGASAAGTVRVESGCERAPGGAEPREPALRTLGRDVYSPPFGFPEVAEGLRVEGFFIDGEPGVRLSFAAAFRRPLAWMGNLVAVGGVSRHFASTGTTEAADVGAGFTPYWGAELTGGLRWDRSAAREVAPWAALRLGPPAYGFTFRADLRDGTVWSFALDLSAFDVVGRFL